MPRPDESERYSEEVALDSDLDWITAGAYKKCALFVLKHGKPLKLRTIIEFGCGSGLCAAALQKTDWDVSYLGVDKSPELLKLAKKHVQEDVHWQLKEGDARTWQKDRDFDVAMAWSLFKHFALDEWWEEVAGRLLSFGQYAAFNVQMAPENIDDGTDFPHVHVSETLLQRLLFTAGHEEVEREVWKEYDDRKDVTLWTRRKS
jgi:trans-aconitate methyltransferase